MEAHEKSFAFMNGAIRIEIPFFQRGYVWNKIGNQERNVQFCFHVVHYMLR